jgi:hypothetical protein
MGDFPAQVRNEKRGEERDKEFPPMASRFFTSLLYNFFT